MIKLTQLLKEIRINQPGKVTLDQLKSLESRIKAFDDPKEQLSLSIQCAEKVLFIFEEKYPDDKRPRQAIEAAKKYLADPTEENKAAAASYTAADAANDAVNDTAYAAYYAAASADAAASYAYNANVAYDANYAAFAAIKAFKLYNNINEIKLIELLKKQYYD
jgi:hypothetical protein